MEMRQVKRGPSEKKQPRILSFIFHFSLFVPLNFLPLTTSKVIAIMTNHPGAYYRASQQTISMGHIQPVSCFCSVHELRFIFTFLTIAKVRRNILFGDGQFYEIHVSVPK